MYEDIAFRFYTNIDTAEFSDVTAVCTYGSHTETLTAEECSQYGANNLFTCMMPARSMNDTITLTVKSGDDVILTEEYSIASYALKLHELNSQYDDLLCSMLDYGTAVQNFFNYNTDKPANSVIGSIKSGWNSEISPSAVKIVPDDTTDYSGVTKELVGYEFEGARLSATAQTRIRLYFSRNDAKAADTTVKIGDKTVVPYQDASTSGYYCVDIGNLHPSEVFNDCTLTFSNGNNSASLTYNAINYYNAAVSPASLNGDNFKKVMERLYVYSCFAAAKNKN